MQHQLQQVIMGELIVSSKEGRIAEKKVGNGLRARNSADLGLIIDGGTVCRYCRHYLLRDSGNNSLSLLPIAGRTAKVRAGV